MFREFLWQILFVIMGCFVFRIARTLSSHRVPTIHVPFWILTQLVPGIAKFNYPTIDSYPLPPGSILRLSISTANFLFKIIHAFLLFHVSTPSGRWKARYSWSCIDLHALKKEAVWLSSFVLFKMSTSVVLTQAPRLYRCPLLRRCPCLSQ